MVLPERFKTNVIRGLLVISDSRVVYQRFFGHVALVKRKEIRILLFNFFCAYYSVYFDYDRRAIALQISDLSLFGDFRRVPYLQIYLGTRQSGKKQFMDSGRVFGVVDVS